ncbi:MAG: PIN domain-containing protein [Melioribacteraceae bacterium]|nr:PIN domain-containing protein [Melioribacteraceae bacterium]MCF8353030.1 PIN domain-containing protein [Melioribacteraceae bacterium]MCF8392921.1 PIN domain-containing protein [Melioribacteraceae bacterium]MCF8417785.1 PIN domain-containing protein [Melioribacteraceae bacterium]
MKILFDSSVLIAAFVESHPKHKTALPYLLKAKNKEFELFVSSHTILEIYSVLTSAPFKPRITPQIAKKLIENNIINLAKIIYLTDKEYFRLVVKMTSSNFSGGIVYDALIVECALKAKTDEIFTLNSKDFIKLTTGKPIRINTL